MYYTIPNHTVTVWHFCMTYACGLVHKHAKRTYNQYKLTTLRYSVLARDFTQYGMYIFFQLVQNKIDRVRYSLPIQAVYQEGIKAIW